MNWDKPFWRSVFSEPDGTGSWSRVFGTPMVLAVITGFLFIVWMNHRLPTLPEAIGLAVVAGATYSVNQIGAAIAEFLKKGQ